MRDAPGDLKPELLKYLERCSRLRIEAVSSPQVRDRPRTVSRRQRLELTVTGGDLTFDRIGTGWGISRRICRWWT
jgi:hypothetical protein